MNSPETRNRKIIDAIIRKEQAVCPGAVALIGIYGSFQTGDVHPLSDLDLLILINDDRGWQLGKPAAGGCIRTPPYLQADGFANRVLPG